MSFFLIVIADHVIDLGVNIDHVATLRNARGTRYPDPMRAALAGRGGRRRRRSRCTCARTAAISSTPTSRDAPAADDAHEPRMRGHAGDARHRLRRSQPHDVCLVPEQRQEVTTEGGLDVAGQFEAVEAAVPAARRCGLARVAVHRRRRDADPRRARSGRAGDRAAHRAATPKPHDDAERQRELRTHRAGRRVRQCARPEGQRRPRPALHQRAADRGDRRASSN